MSRETTNTNKGMNGKTKKNVQSEVWVETEQSTIMDAFIFLTRSRDDDFMRHGNRMNMRLDQTENAASRYLMRRLNMTLNQIQLLACVMYHTQGVGQSCDADDITRYLDAHPLEIFAMNDDLETLVKAGYLQEEECSMGKEWKVRKEAIKALGQNRALDINVFKASDTISLLADCIHIIREGRVHDLDDEIENQIRWLFTVNEEMPFVKNVYALANGDVFSFIPNLRSVHIGKGVRALSNWHFRCCLKLRVIDLSKENPHLKIEDGLVLSADGKEFWRSLFHRKELRIPEGVECVKDVAC